MCLTNSVMALQNLKKVNEQQRLESLSSEQAYKEFSGMFEKMAYQYSPSEVFLDFIDYSLIMFRWWEKKNGFSSLEKKYGDRYSMFQELFTLYSIAADNDGIGMHDALGDLFMDLVSHGNNGQFFTPEEVCDMSADIIIQDSKAKGNILDPACGSGRLLLSAAKKNREFRLYGCDIDQTCCKMAVLNLLSNSLQGEIACMDSLRMEYNYSWKVGYNHIVGLPCPLPVYEYITDKEKSTLWKLHINSFAQNNAEPPKAVPAEIVVPTPQIAIPVPTTRSRARNKSNELQLELF